MNRSQRRREKPPVTTKAVAKVSLPVLLGRALAAHQADDHPTAEGLYREILTRDPRHPDALHFLGLIHYQRHDIDSAAHLIQQSLDLHPSSASFHSNFGMVLHAQRKLDEAAVHYRTALAHKPDFAQAHNNLGNVLLEQGCLEDALAHYETAFTLQHEYVEARTNIGVVLARQGLLDHAIDHYRNALSDGISHAPLHYNLGNTLAAQDKHGEAIAEYKSALLLDPGYVDAHNNIGVSLQATNRLDEALDWYRRTLELQPNHAKAHFHTGMIYLLRGDLSAGWPHYEHRHRATPEAQMRVFPQPQWRGEPLLGRRILLHPEQGLGDTLQFLRYVLMVQAVGGHVLLLVEPSLRRLATHLPGLTVSVEIVEDEQNLPPFDLHCPLLGLPLAFGTMLATIPAPIPYLTVPEPELAYANSLRWPTQGLRVGLVWAGNPTQLRDRFRSLPLTAYDPLLSIEGVHFFSLQAGPGAAQLRSSNNPITDLDPDLDNMADTAAKLLHLDLVITVCTSVAHLAGALGVPTWVLLPNPADWRWFQDRTDSPWYPSARLFRQPTPGDWASVITQVGEALIHLAEHPPQRIPMPEPALAAV